MVPQLYRDVASRALQLFTPEPDDILVSMLPIEEAITEATQELARDNQIRLRLGRSVVDHIRKQEKYLYG